ncbi:MAG: hypothetical protein AB1Z22_00910 [Synechococcaceae cyanobacterium]
MRVVPLRFTPGDDLRLTLEAWRARQHEQAGCLISGIGSLVPLLRPPPPPPIPDQRDGPIA